MRCEPPLECLAGGALIPPESGTPHAKKRYFEVLVNLMSRQATYRHELVSQGGTVRSSTGQSASRERLKMSERGVSWCTACGAEPRRCAVFGLLPSTPCTRIRSCRTCKTGYRTRTTGGNTLLFVVCVVRCALCVGMPSRNRQAFFTQRNERLRKQNNTSPCHIPVPRERTRSVISQNGKQKSCALWCYGDRRTWY